jgi:hypothetical protein
VTTYIGVQYTQAQEIHPITRLAFQTFGMEIMLLAKFIVFTVAFIFWVRAKRELAWLLPLTLCILGIIITTWNTYVILVSL